mgnify:CR=1 FL=1
MISAERLVALRAKVKAEMIRRSNSDHGENASMRRFAASDYDYNISPVTGDITDEHIQKIIDPLLNVADFLQDNSLQQSHSGADVIVDRAERFVDTLAIIDKQSSQSGCRGLCTGLCVGSCSSGCQGCSGCTGGCDTSCAKSCSDGCSTSCGGCSNAHIPAAPDVQPVQ